MPSKLELYTFARLKSAKHETNTNHHGYKSGATFSGTLHGNKRSGIGVFLWPSGDRYEGEYVDNERYGKGEQKWSDSSYYKGDFVNDTRHGQGHHEWANGESYQGSYFKDHRHGDGVYKWPGGLKFEGKFYMDKKEGYGDFTFPNASKFKGLYKDDEREGPGVMTYPDKKEDVGLWRRERLVKLTSKIEGAFTMKDHSEFEYVPEESLITVYVGTENHHLNKNHQIKDTINAGFDSQDIMTQFSDTNLWTNFDTFQPSRPESVDMRTLEYDQEEYDAAFFADNHADDHQESFVALNNTPSLINMQKHIHKHRYQGESVFSSVSDIMQGERKNSSAKGPIETASESLIRCAAAGNLSKVNTLLCGNESNVNVADQHGHHSLLATAVNMHQDVINCLLDNGADVNKLNDEGVSALAACHVLFYPIESFKYNIAERYLPKPQQEIERERLIWAMASPSVTPVNSNRTEFLKENNQEATNTEDDFDEAEIVDDGDDFLDDDLLDNNVDSLYSESLDDLEAAACLKKIPSTEPNDFGSNKSLVNYRINVNDDLVERSATVMSGNPKIVAGRTSKSSVNEPNMDRARLLAISKAQHSVMEATIRLLLKRGADPNASRVPMAVLFFAVKAADVDAVKVLLEKGALTDTRLSTMKEGLMPLHISSAIRGKAGVEITRLLLQARANPNVRAWDDDLTDQEGEFTPVSPSKLKPGLDNSVLALSRELQAQGEDKGGRTPLHIVCQRDDDDKLAQKVVNLLLSHGANPNVLCRGQSPLSLAIACGNDLAIDELLAFSSNPSLPLGQHIGSALCVASNTAFEFRRSPQDRINLITKLVKAGANILAPVAVGAKKLMGTAVDYAYWAFNQDRRIAHMPYHALTHTERDTYNARRRLLAYLGDILREASVRKEKERLAMNNREGIRSISPSLGFLYTGAGAQVLTGEGLRLGGRHTSTRTSPLKPFDNEGGKQVAFHIVTKDNAGREKLLVDIDDEAIIRKPLFKYCYECGRSLGVRLSPCTRCKEVYYCSKACKLKAWNARHKEECVRVGSRSRSPSPTNKTVSGSATRDSDSPTPATYAGSGIYSKDGGRSAGLNAKGQRISTKGGNNGAGTSGQVKGRAGSSGQVKGKVNAGGSGQVKGKVNVHGSRGMASNSEDILTDDTTENYSFN